MDEIEPIEIWTMCLSQWRTARQRGLFILDISTRSGIKSFSPSAQDVYKLRRGLMGKEEYSHRYFGKMAQSQYLKPQVWAKLGELKKAAIACYCDSNTFCHRYLFTPLLEQELQKQGKKYVLKGELHRESPPAAA